MSQTEPVRRLLALYCQLLDDARYDDWSQLFTPDALWVLGAREYRGRPALKSYMDQLRGERPDWRTRHLCTNLVIDLDGTTGRVTSDLAFLSRSGDEPWRVASLGRYHDQIVQRADAPAWQVAERRLVIL
jgi:3-phenylpropionate/cinnamic acid dioxygenase small subunit